MLKIIKHPDKILLEVMPAFDFSNPIFDPVQLEKEMIETMLANDGIGLSANQVGIRAQVFVMGHRDYPELAQAFFNPQIMSNTENILDLEEGCLSFPKIFVKIKRPSMIRARWQNSQGEWQEDTFDGYNCKCFLHEYDHLQGITFKDRVSQLKWNLSVKKSIKEKI
jgi:peptide deformylase